MGDEEPLHDYNTLCCRSLHVASLSAFAMLSFRVLGLAHLCVVSCSFSARKHDH